MSKLINRTFIVCKNTFIKLTSITLCGKTIHKVFPPCYMISTHSCLFLALCYQTQWPITTCSSLSQLTKTK